MLLKYLLPVFLFCSGSVSFSASAAWADEYIVIILGSAYFPQKTAVEMGDVVRFVNVSGQEHTVIHSDGAWMTLPIEDGEELLVQIEKGMTGAFYGQAKELITGRLDLLRRPLTN